MGRMKGYSNKDTRAVLRVGARIEAHDQYLC